jgi:hypothetical protein
MAFIILQTLINQRQEIAQFVGSCAENDDRYSPARKRLRVLQTPIHSQKDLEAESLSNLQQFSVFLACESNARNRGALVVTQAVLEFPRKTLVEQNPHPN